MVKSLPLVCMAMMVVPPLISASDWPQFRGPDGQGHSAAQGLALRWNEKKNVTWKVPVRGRGLSSPVIVGDRLWLTTAVEADRSLCVNCLDATSGKLVHEVEVFRKESLWGIHSKNSHASPTPVIAGDRCYVHFGSHGTAALNLQGQVLWRTELPYYHHHGPGSCPVLADDLLVIACDGFTRSFYDDRVIAGVTAPQFVTALDVMTGQVRWKSPREGTHSYATPLVIDVDGQKQIVSPGGNRVSAYDPGTGQELWFCRYTGYSVVPRPVFGHGLVFVCTGYDHPELLAIRPDGRGDVTDTHVVWKSSQAVPLNPSPILAGTELYTVSDLGIASCLDAATGTVHWRQRIGGNFSASPLLADGRLYFLNEDGDTTVVMADRKYRFLAKNRLEGATLSSLSVSGNAIFVRTDTHLYRIDDSGTDDGDPPAPADNNGITTEDVKRSKRP